MPLWAVAIASPGSEAKALVNVERASFEYFCPRIKSKRFSWRGRKVVRDEWLFSRYFFVVVGDRWRVLEASVGVQGVIRFGENVATLPDGVILAVRKQCDSNGYYIPATPGRFKRGQKVRIGDGPYINELAVYQHMKAGDRADVLLQFVGVWVHASVSEGSLEAA